MAGPNAAILVTGATGFIGRHLVARLVREGRRVRCLARRDVAIPGAEVVRGDLAAGQGLREAVEGVDVVLHLGGVTKALSRQDYQVGNVRGTCNLLAVCPPSVRLVHISSLAAAGPSPDGTPLAEDAPPRPVSGYGRSKWEAELAVGASALSERAVILRPAVVYGPGDTDVYQVFRAVSRGLFATVGRSESWFSFIYVEDLVRAILMAAASDRAAGKTYFVANPLPVSWGEFASLAACLMGRRVRTVRIPSHLAYAAAWASELAARRRRKPGIFSRDKVREAVYPYWVCNPARAFHDFGFQAATSLRDGMAATLAWYKNSGWLKY